MVYDRKDFQPAFGIPKDAKTARLFDWHLKLNHAHTYAIRATLKLHARPDAGQLGSAVITCSASNKVKLARVPHRRTRYTASPVTVLCTDLAGPMDVTGKLERDIIKHSPTSVSSRGNNSSPSEGVWIPLVLKITLCGQRRVHLRASG